jgi:hypothetical protein
VPASRASKPCPVTLKCQPARVNRDEPCRLRIEGGAEENRIGLATRLSVVVASEKAQIFTGMGDGSPKLFPDRERGFWLPYSGDEPGLQIVHVVDGNVVTRRTQMLPNLQQALSQSAWIDEDGNLLMVASVPWTAGTSSSTLSVYRYDVSGQGRATALVSWPVPATSNEDTSRFAHVQPKAFVRTARDGGILAAVELDEMFRTVRRWRTSLYQIDPAGHVTSDRPIYAPIQSQGTGPTPVGLRAMYISPEGMPRIALFHRVALSFDGAVVTPPPLRGVDSYQSGTISIVTLQANAAAMKSVWTLAPASCVRLGPESVMGMTGSTSAAILLGGASRLPGCWDGRRSDGAVSRLQE